MSHHSVVSFWREVQTNAELQRKLGDLLQPGAADRSARASRIARDAGFEFTPREMQEVESVAAFWKRVETDDTLYQELKPAHESEASERAKKEISRVAKAAGYDFPEEALECVTSALVNSGRAAAGKAGPAVPLSDEQLAGVAGGASFQVSFDLARRSLWQEVLRVGPGVVGAKP